MAQFRYTVRKMVNGRNGSVKWYVYDLRTKGRVTVHATLMRDAAQAQADNLNIIDTCPDAEQDPRPFEVRYAEAEAKYHATVKGA
jgi:hypothetical protein